YKPTLLIFDEHGDVLFGNTGPVAEELLQNNQLHLQDEKSVEQITLRHGDKFYVVKRKLESNTQTIGWVVLLSPEKEIARSTEELKLLAIMLGSLGLLGWVVIYLLTRKLSEPIKDVADAAKQIVTGNYDIHFQKNVKEKEIYELIHSFKDMTDRLRQLELMRTELLAGVTHELKTPVTSISGLVQAVRDEIVTGEESKEFLEICAKETNRLQKMVEDLLDFNTYAMGDMKVSKELLNMNELIQEITHQWLIVQEEDSVKLTTLLPEQSITAATDPLRVQQILYNLLNNAKQAVVGNGTIEVSLSGHEREIRIDVQDSGTGIPEEERHLIFERFFRGKQKKHKVRGLGLGLPFSRMMAKSLGGDLQLKQSSDAGTTFTIVLPK
ncbi:histidine kinase, partial [Bradyrhizobium japonicum]